VAAVEGVTTQGWQNDDTSAGKQTITGLSSGFVAENEGRFGK